LVADLARQKLEVQSLNGKAVEYTALEREATSNREVLDRLLQRSRESALTRELQPTNIRVLDWADTPAFPILPRKARNVVIGLFGSGGLALALILLLEAFNTRLTSPEDVRQHLRIRVLGVVPRVKPQNGRASPLLGNEVPGQFAEMLRGVRTNLVLAPELGAGHTLLVTSSEPSEGKTTSAANIAVSLARLRQRVLLIDADLRKPRLHEMFGEDQKPGLADVLSGKTSSRDLVEQALGRITDKEGEGARAFLQVNAEGARAEADFADALRKRGARRSPIDGLPVSLKDLFDVAGEVTRAGSKIMENVARRADAAAVARLRAAGAVFIGRTNMVEFAFGGVGLNPHYGTPKNPWDRKTGRVPGGGERLQGPLDERA